MSNRTKRQRAAGSAAPAGSVCAHDRRILDDYAAFRKIRHAVLPRICPAQWDAMNKRTKAALVRMVALAATAAAAGKLGTPNAQIEARS